MDYMHEFFRCNNCEATDFKKIYSFSLRFHGVNFSDELIYDRIVDEKYQCINCGKTFSLTDIENGLEKIKRKYKQKDSTV